MTRHITLAALAVLLLAPAAVRAQMIDPGAPSFQAQTPPPPAAARATPRGPFLRAYFLFDNTSMTAADSFDAVLGTSSFEMPGGGGEALNLWKGLFARVAFSSVRESGSRVVVIDDQVIPLDIPVTVELKPLEIAAGWRLPAFAAGRLVAYAGGGFLRMGYRETSDFAIGEENTDTTFSGGVVFGGIEASIVSWIIAGAEVQYRTVPNAIGGAGVSEAFGETDLGGTTVRVLVGIRR